jgi:hypothetical protein
MTQKQIIAEIIEIMSKEHNQPVKVKRIERLKRIVYPTGLKGYIGKILITAKGFKPTAFHIDKTDGYRLRWYS